jgi:hypothetical protein
MECDDSIVALRLSEIDRPVLSDIKPYDRRKNAVGRQRRDRPFLTGLST